MHRARLRRRWRRTLAAQSTLGIYEHAHGPVLARTRTSPCSTRELALQVVDLTTELLQAHAVDYFVREVDHGRDYVVGVRAAERDRVYTALADTRPEDVLYAAAETLRGPADIPRPLAEQSSRRRLRHADAIRLCQYVRSANGVRIGGPEHGCVLEFWHSGATVLERSDGPSILDRLHVVVPEDRLAESILCTRPNPVSQIIPSEEQQPARITIGDRNYPTLCAFTHPVAHTVNFPIDLVYTWVDGSDPEWAARRDAYLRERGEALHRIAASATRYESRDELKYSLRSVEMFAPFVRTIHIVTDGQVPDWLDTEHERVHLVDHRDIFPSLDVLPVFSSRAIETRIHHIPGLSEHYIYLNDDMMFGRYVAPDTFFHANGIGKSFLSQGQIGLGEPTGADHPPRAAAKNTRALLQAEFGPFITRTFKHAPYPMRRSVAHELDERFPEAIARTTASRFRSPSDVTLTSSLYPNYALMTGRAVPGEISSAYINLAKPAALRRRTDALLRGPRTFDSLCLNDTEPLPPRKRARVDAQLQHFLEHYFPLASSMERS
ncbi:Stealth CR1 domain-containing protein [Lipingzhangella sp. LS1_29]|uniref:Stealth CR1 domain-containing protein n=1 Tax=Lipingzhangella rawalii TaxID=2055835 RepID=A0ABU2H9I3_9ACTN|nr:Stealth CR1 domain-containing protein [Lipingzhangella rawalii]